MPRKPSDLRLAPDTIRRLEHAAALRFSDANELPANRQMTAIYLYGYCVEMCLTAAYFRCAGFSTNECIDRETRKRRMGQARLLRAENDEPLMNSDPHPLVGWARFLDHQRSASTLTPQHRQLLREAINKATLAYQHWRPELRYKTIRMTDADKRIVQDVASWFLENRGLL